MTISSLIEAIPVSPKGLPVIFNGAEPRHIGYARTHLQADACALEAHVSATFVSRVQAQLPDGTMSAPFFVLHDGVRR